MPFLEPQSVVLATLGAALLLFVTETLRYDLVALLVVLVLAGTGTLTAEEAFAGFSSPAVFLVASMFVFAHAVNRCGLAEAFGQRVLAGGKPSEGVLAAKVTAVSGVLSSMLSDTAVVATLIPVLGSISRSTRVPLSRLLIPLSFGALIGGMVTVIGTAVNIAINGVVGSTVIGGRSFEPFGLFEFSLYGLCLLATGALYFLGPGHRLLPRSRVDETLSEHYQLPKFVSEVLVEPSSMLINRTVAETEFTQKYGITVLGIARSGETSILAPGPYHRIRTEDVLVLQGDPESIVRLRADLGLRERSTVDVGDRRLTADDVQLVEAVVPAGSVLVGRTVQESDLSANNNLNVLAVSKHGDVQPSSVGRTRLEVGDTLLLQGHKPDIDRIRRSRQVLVLGEIEVHLGGGALVVVGMLAAVLLAAGLGGIGLPVAALGGAVGLVLTGMIRPDEVRASVDWSVLVLIGGMLALGNAFDKYAIGNDVATWILRLGSDSSEPRVLIAALLLGTTLLTQLTNYVTAGVIMTPVALSLASQLAVSERAFVMAVVTGASMALVSPVAHQANAMVMGPGDYKYFDFVKVGLPLTILLCALAIFLLPIFWPLVAV